MANFSFDIATRCKSHYDTAEIVHMAVDRSKRTVLPECPCDIHCITPHAQNSRWINPENPSSEVLDLIIIFTSFVAMDEEVKLNVVSIDCSIDVHHQGLRAASIHFAEHVQNPSF
jgi:hypothetical protein